ncbi:MAG: PEP-CTERM sorting domain-containing protein, partial [Candidatus Omnitrophota bacterium]
AKIGPTGGGGVIPEPATMSLLGLGLLGMALTRRKKKGDGMKKAKLLLTVLGILLMSGTLANAAVIDVIQSPTGFFVPDNSQVYDWPYYRWYGDDWGWTHNAIGGSITTATLNIDAWDVDASSGEVDEIYAFDDGVMTYLGNLAGLNDDWGYSSFALGSNFYDDIASGLEVWMVIDETDAGWAVTLAKSALSIDGGTLPPPGPGAPIPEPATLSLLGLGLLGLAGLKRKKVLESV